MTLRTVQTENKIHMQEILDKRLKTVKFENCLQLWLQQKKEKVAFKCPKVTSKQVFVIRRAIYFSFFDQFQQYTRFDIC